MRRAGSLSMRRAPWACPAARAAYSSGVAGLRSLQPFARRSEGRTALRCELCSAPIGERHAHVVERAQRTLRCSCGACALLFRHGGADARRRTVPERVIVDEAFAPGDADWARLGIPVQLAFAMPGEAGWTVWFPSPAGAVEAALSDEAARALAAATPLARCLEPDVEALLLRRTKAGVATCLLAPIDLCHELVALVRRHWRGFSGGDEAERAVDDFFARLRARADRRVP